MRPIQAPGGTFRRAVATETSAQQAKRQALQRLQVSSGPGRDCTETEH